MIAATVAFVPVSALAAPVPPVPLAETASTVDAVETGSVEERPDTRFVGKPVGRIQTIERRAKASFRFLGSKGTRRFKCRSDRGRWHYCRSPVRVREGPGRHRFAVRAVGRPGQFDRSPAVRHWRMDRWEPHFRQARQYAKQRTGKISFAVDVGWRSQDVRGGLTALTASSIKVMLMAAYLERRSVRPRRLNGNERSLLEAMIRRSDNGAASTVFNQVGETAIRRLAGRAGMKDFRSSVYWGLCRTSARDQAHFMRNLKRYIPARHWRFSSRQLAHITSSQRWGIAEVDHRGWKLYFKGGWGISDGRYGGMVDHQIALLQRGRWRIGVAILTQGKHSLTYGNETLKGVASRLLRGLP